MPRRTTTVPTSRLPKLGRKRATYERISRYQGSARVPAAPVAEHIQSLRELGLPYASIARDAGVQLTTVYRMGRNPSTHIKIANAVTAVTHQPNPRQQSVLAIGALRRVRALAAIGWSHRIVAEHANVPVSTVLQLHATATVSWPVWSAIRDTYETLSATPATIGRPSRCRGEALRKGWPAPLDWEDHDIDDPRVMVAAQPWQPKTMQDLIAERRARVVELTEAGLSSAEIADRLGVTQRTVVRDRAEVGVAAA